MKRITVLIAAVLSAALLGLVNSPGAAASSVQAYCDTPAGVFNDQRHVDNYHWFTDSGGFTRVTWEAFTIYNNTSVGNGTEYYAKMVSDAGTHYALAPQTTGSRAFTIPVPSSANARLAWHPYLWVESGASADGFARCHTKINF